MKNTKLNKVQITKVEGEGYLVDISSDVDALLEMFGILATDTIKALCDSGLSNVKAIYTISEAVQNAISDFIDEDDSDFDEDDDDFDEDEDDDYCDGDCINCDLYGGR